MKNLNFLEKLWEHGRTLRRVGLVLVMCLITITQMWAWSGIKLRGDWMGGFSYQSDTWTYGSEGNKYWDVYHPGGTKYWRLHLDYFNHDIGPNTGNYALNVGTSGYKVVNTGDKAFMTTANAGILRIQSNQTTGGGEDERPYVWVTRPAVKFKYDFNNDHDANWEMVTATDNQDGTYTYRGLYCGTDFFCAGPNDGDKKAHESYPTSVVGEPSAGDRCEFKWEATGYKYVGSEDQNCGVFTITKLCSVTYNTNGATSGSAPANQEFLYGAANSLQTNSGSLVKTGGYVFTGWNTASDGSGTNYDEGQSVNLTSNLTLHAEWTEASWGIKGGEGNKDEGAGADHDAMGNWITFNSLQRQGSTNEYIGTISLEAHQTYCFKVYNISGDEYYGYGTDGKDEYTITYIGQTGAMELYNNNGSDHNLRLMSAGAGEYTFTWNSSTHLLKVDFPEVTHPSVDYVYYTNPNDWGSVMAHLWGGAASTGWLSLPTLQTYVDGTTTYYYTPVGNSTTGLFADGVNTNNKTGDLPVSANFGKSYSGSSWSAFSVTINLDNQGADGGKEGTTSKTVNLGYENIAASDISTPTKTGYSFGGYYTEEDGEGKMIIDGSGVWQTDVEGYIDGSGNWIKDGKTNTLYAKWTEKTWSVSAVVSPDGAGYASPSEATTFGEVVGGAITASDNSGYDFSKWVVSSGAGSFVSATSASTTYKPTSASTIKAIFCPESASGKTVYKFEVKSNVSDGNICSGVNQDPVMLNTTTHLTSLEGGTLGAKIAASGNVNNLAFKSGEIRYANGSYGVLILSLDCSLKTGDVIRYVNYSSSNSKYNYLRHTSNSTSTNQITLNASTTAGTVQEIVVPSAFNNKDVLYIVSGSNTTGISSFEIIRPYVVTLNATTNGGTVTPSAMYFAANEAQALPHAIKSDYRFKGWFTTSDGSSEAANPYTATGSTTLYAQFEDCPTADATVYKFQVKTGLTNGNKTAGELNVGNYLSTLVGGTATITGTHAQIANTNAIDLANNGDYITVDLDCALASGDKFIATVGGSEGIKIKKTIGGSDLVTISNGVEQEGDVPAGLVGEKTFYIYRYDSNTGGISYFEIYRPEACTAITPTWTTAYTSTTLTLGGGNSSAPEVNKGGSTGAITWTSSNTDVATVNSSGVVTPKKVGTATITATVAAAGGKCEGSVSAEFTIKGTVTYDANGASGGSVPTDANTYAKDAKITVAGKNTLTKADCAFAGWNTKANGSGDWYIPGEKITMGESNITLHAQWATCISTSDFSGRKTAGYDDASETSSDLKTTFSILNKLGGSTTYDNSSGYTGLKLRNSGDWIGFAVAAGSSVTVTTQTVSTSPTVTIDFSSATTLSANTDNVYAADNSNIRFFRIKAADGAAVVINKITIGASCTTNPTVTAGSNSSVTSTTATVSCESGISSLGTGGCTITSYGFVIGTSTNPEIDGEGVTRHQVGTSIAASTSFSKNLTGLTASTTYYVRPYATNGNGTAYGTETSFTTLPTTPTFSPASGSTVSGSQTITITGHSGSTVYYAWATSAQDADDIYNSGSGDHGTADAGTVSVAVQSGKTLYAISRLSDVNSSVSSASYTIDDTAPTLSSSVPANSATNVNTSGTIVLTFSEAIASVDANKFTLTNATKGAVAIDGSDNTKVNIPYSGASNSTTVTLATAAGAVTDAVGNSSAALGSISFTTKAAAASLTAISANTLYQAADMATITLTSTETAWDAGLSSNNLFKTYGGSGNTAKGNTITQTTVSGRNFTSKAYIMEANNTSSSDDPTKGAIEFITPSKAGKLLVYTVDGSDSKLSIKKQGASSSTTTNATCKTVDVEANTHYFINGAGGSRGIYGIYYDKLPEFVSSSPASGAEDVSVSGTIVLTFDESIASVDDSKFSLTGATIGVVEIDGEDNKKVNIAYSEASNSTTVTLSVAANAVTDAVGNKNAALSSISFTTEAAAPAPAASCITWEGTPSSWTSSAMTVDENLVLKAVGKDWSINSSTVYPKYAKVWVEDETEIIKTVIAIDDHAVGKYLQGSFADGSVIQSLTIGAANNSGTAGTNNNYVVMFSATEDFATVLADGSGNKAQVVSAPSYKDTYNASNLEKSITVPTGAKFFRIYRKIVGAGDSPWTIGDWTVQSDMGSSSAKFRIFKIEACPVGASCTNPTIAWDNAPANGVVGGTMTASVTSNYPAGVTYSSSDETVASVNASTGVISYLKAGSATITATVEGDGTTYCNLPTDPSVSQAITVTAVATGITVTPSTIDVQVGGTENLDAALTPAGAADETVTWTSEFTANATVALADEDEDKAAVVTGVALRPGGTSFKIYAKTSRLTANSWYATVRVYKGVTYDASTNGGTCATETAKYYGDAALVLPAATKTDNTFTGWYTASSGGTKVGDAGDEYTPTANSTTLYAQFTANVTTYAITYELNGGTHGSTHPTTGTPNNAHELSAPTRSGYTFTGWSVSPVVSGAKWGETSSPATDITDASKLAKNGTSSVYFKNLAAANGAVTITAHWTQDCETSGGGGGSTTLFAWTKGDGAKIESDETSLNGNDMGNMSTGTSIVARKLGTNDINNSANGYKLGNNDVAIEIQGTSNFAVGDVVTITGRSGNSNSDSRFFVVAPTTVSSVTSGSFETSDTVCTNSFVNDNSDGEYSVTLKSAQAGSKIRIFRIPGKSMLVKAITVTRSGSGGEEIPCFHVIYHANGAERGAVEDAARYEEGDVVTVKPNGFTKAGETFRGWATSQDNATAGTVAYDPEDDDHNTFIMGGANVNLYAVWGTAAPRVYSLTGSAYRCTSDAASTITLAGSETDVSYQLYKDGVADGDPVTDTGSSLTWSKSAWGTYTVVATRSAVSSTMSGEVVLSDYPLVVTENLNGGTVAQNGAFTLSAKVSVHADNSDNYTYQWYSNNEANYDSPTSLGDATNMAASTGTQEFEYNPSTAEGGTTYYFCEFKSPCNTVVRTRVVSVKVTTATTDLTWDRDGEGDDFEDLPQGGKHTITVTSNSGVAPSLEVAGTDVELTDVEQDAGTATTTATLVLGASAADVVLTAEVSANGTYAAKSEDKEVIVKECSSGETVLYEMHLTNYNTYSVNSTYGGSASIGSFESSNTVTAGGHTHYKAGGNLATITLKSGEKILAGDKIKLIVTASKDTKTTGYYICKSSSNSTAQQEITAEMVSGTEYELVYTVQSSDANLVNATSILFKRYNGDLRFYGISIVRGGGSGSTADVPSGIAWIIDPDPGHEQDEKAITRSISNDPFTFAVQATTPSMGTITYASSNEAVATVDANGRVTLIGEGSTEISAKQEAIGCYLESSALSYDLTVETCTGEKEPVITYAGTVICPVGSQRLTATNYEEGATIQWYKDGVEIDGEDEATYDATEAGTYTVVAHNRCYSESSNSVTLTKMSATVDVKTYADEFTIKSERPYNFRLFEIEDGATMTVQSRSGIDAENSVVTQSGNTITISGTAPTIDATGNATIVIRISRTGCSDSHVDTTVTIHKIPATAKPTIAWIATGTKGDKEDVAADESNNVDLYKELEKYYTVTARNCYWTTSEAELVKEYSQYDLIVLTDYPNSQTAPSGKGAGKSYTNALGLLKDHIPMLTFEAYVAQCPNWEIPSNPQNTSNTQNDITLLCNADEIFGTSGKFGAGSAISVSTVGSGQALQGFLPTDAPFVFIGSITDDATTYIACCERQVNPAARMMIFGLNANTMNNLTSDGKEMVRGFINYLMISDAASIPDCSVIFNGNGGDQNWNTEANWEGNTMPNQYASVRIDKPCVVSGDYVAQAGYLKIHTSSEGDTYTGKLTIASDGVMAIDGTITRVEDNRYTLHLPTRPVDLIIESNASGQGALIFDNDEGTTQATVKMYTKAYYDGAKDHWQYVAVPLASANRWSLGSWTYQHDNVAGSWDYYVDNFSAFEAVAVAQDAPTTYVFEGALASTKPQKISMPATNAIEGTSLIGNSWTAPIQIVNFEESDFGGAKASIFIYETGYDPDGVPTSELGNSGERAAGKWYEIPVFGAATLVTNGGWAGMKVIPAMQAFEVKNESGAPTTFTMNYDRLVRTATNDMNEARRAPRRMNTSYGIPTMRLTLSDGEIRNDVYLISGEQFSEGFDNGWDGEYVGGNNCSQLYALSPIGNLSMSSQPEMEGTVLGFAAGNKTEFTITFRYTGEEKLYLNDMEAHQSTLISSENEYLFTAESGEKGDRFVIGEQLFGAPGIATGVTDLDAEATEAQKIIYNDKLYIIRGGKVYSAEGQLVK